MARPPHGACWKLSWASPRIMLGKQEGAEGTQGACFSRASLHAAFLKA